MGVMCLAQLDTGPRPFLPIAQAGPDGTWVGWLFPLIPTDDASQDLRIAGHSPAARRAPCYCKVALAALRQL
jgi:hypothetical protein